MLLTLVSFATGALFANVFFHILPEVMEETTNIELSLGLVLMGILLSFVIEKFIHWHHCHNLECSHTKPIGTMVIIADGVHNATDGILIAATFLVDTELGIATTIAVILHEIPQEIGEFAILLHAGFSRAKALLWNFASALTAFVGAIAVLLLHEYIHGIEIILLPLIAGNFLYIAASDLVPELHKESKIKNLISQLLAMVAGIALMYSLVLGGGHSHIHDDEHQDGEHIEDMHN